MAWPATGLIGAVLGFVIQWPISLLYMRLYGAGYSGTEPHWDVGFATFDAALHAAPIGALLAVLAYGLFLRKFPPGLVARSIPGIFLATFCGALPGMWIGIGALGTIVPCFLLGVIHAAYLLSRQCPDVRAHPFGRE